MMLKYVKTVNSAICVLIVEFLKVIKTMFTQNQKNAVMIHTQILGLSIIFGLSLITSCNSNQEGVVYDRLIECHEEMKDHYFKDYCNNPLNVDSEGSEILSSFIGNHKKASLLAAHKNEKYLVDIFEQNENNEAIKNYLNEQLNKHEVGTDEYIVFQRLLNVLYRPKDIKDLFEEY